MSDKYLVFEAFRAIRIDRSSLTVPEKRGARKKEVTVLRATCEMLRAHRSFLPLYFSSFFLFFSFFFLFFSLHLTLMRGLYLALGDECVPVGACERARNF